MTSIVLDRDGQQVTAHSDGTWWAVEIDGKRKTFISRRDLGIWARENGYKVGKAQSPVRLEPDDHPAYGEQAWRVVAQDGTVLGTLSKTVSREAQIVPGQRYAYGYKDRRAWRVELNRPRAKSYRSSRADALRVFEQADEARRALDGTVYQTPETGFRIKGDSRYFLSKAEAEQASRFESSSRRNKLT